MIQVPSITEVSLELKPPLVSVVIPTYNRAALLSTTLDSVLAQSYPNIEIIVVDDGSTDNTPDIMQRYRDRVTYSRKTNGGLASARNVGIELSRGEFIAIMDSDDLCLPQRIALQVACFRQIPEIVLCSSDFSAFIGKRVIETSHIGSYYRAVSATEGGLKALYSQREELRTAGVTGIYSKPKEPITILCGQIYKHLVWGNFIHPPTVMVRHSVIKNVGGFEENIANATDYDWLIRVSRAGLVAYLDTPLLMYRYSNEQLSGPQHSAQISLDTVKTLSKVRDADPVLYQRHWFRFRRRIGTCYLNAANASIEQDKIRSFSQLLKSIKCCVFTPQSLKVIGKLILPRVALRFYRRFRPTCKDEAQESLTP